MTTASRLILACIIRRGDLVVNDFDRRVNRLARRRETFDEVGVLLSGLLLFLLTVFLRKVSPLTVGVLIRRADSNERHLLTVTGRDRVDLSSLVSFQIVGVGVSSLDLLNVFKEGTHSAITRSRASNGRRVALLDLRVNDVEAVRARRARVRQVITEGDEGARRNAADQSVDLLGRFGRFVVDAARFCTVASRDRETLYLVSRFDDFDCDLFVGLQV